MTKACASGCSSVIVRWMKASRPAGVIAARRSAAPPVSRIVGWPLGQIDDAHVAPEHAVAQAGAERLGAGLLGGEALGVGGGALGAAVAILRALDLGEAARDEALAEALERLLDAADVAEVAADAEDHRRPRPRPSPRACARIALGEADEDRLADEEMADVELDDLAAARRSCAPCRSRGRGRRGIRGRAARVCAAATRRCGANSCVGLRRVAMRDGVAPGAGVQLDHRRPQRRGRLERFRRGLDEQRNADARAAEFGDEGLQIIVAADDVEAALGGALGALLRHQAAGVRAGLQRDVEHLLGRRHLEIERLGDRGLQPPHVVVADVAAILAQMRGDAVGAGFDREQRRAHRIGQRRRRARCARSRRDRR